MRAPMNRGATSAAEAASSERLGEVLARIDAAIAGEPPELVVYALIAAVALVIRAGMGAEAVADALPAMIRSMRRL